MPVGNADRGVGLWAGQVMFSIDNSNQYIDWWHEALPGSGENFAHKGTLSSIIFSPSLTIGLSNYWNMTITQNLGNRIMTWGGDTTTIHHRDEGSHTSFKNAVGGVLGDTRLLFRYLIHNDGKGAGKRLFIGSGFVIPSKNTLKSDPFFLSGEPKEEHRHFAMSEGVYKTFLEVQYFKKRMTTPVFIGGSFLLEAPIQKNKFGFKGSNTFNINISMYTKDIKIIRGPLGGNISIHHTGNSYWNGKKTPNSEATILTIGSGVLWNLKKGTLGVSLQKPIYLIGGFSGADANVGDIDQTISALQIMLSYRWITSYTIPWLDPLKNI